MPVRWFAEVARALHAGIVQCAGGGCKPFQVSEMRWSQREPAVKGCTLNNLVRAWFGSVQELQRDRD